MFFKNFFTNTFYKIFLQKYFYNNQELLAFVRSPPLQKSLPFVEDHSEVNHRVPI